MRIAALTCNILLLGFTGVVLLVDGPPRAARYIVFTLWTLSTLILSAVVMARGGAATTKVVAIVGNIILMGFVGWAFVDQYPHPEEDGFIAFVVLMVLTPLLSLAVLARERFAAHGGPR
jgi:hypothetical protein